MRTADQRRAARKVSRATRQALHLMPADGDLPQLLTNVSRFRGRPLHLIENDPCDAQSGLWIAKDGTDFVMVDRNATPSRRAAIVCHEIAHMLLDHQGDAGIAHVADHVAPDLDPSLVARMLARHGYSAEIEQEAEAMGTVLATELARRAAQHAMAQDNVSARLR